MQTKSEQRQIRHRRVRRKVEGTTDIPRLSVFRSNKYLYAQLIDDTKMITIAQTSSLKAKKEDIKDKKQLAFTVGEEIAKVATAKKIKKVVFDRGGYKYHGLVKHLADGARKGGLVF